MIDTIRLLLLISVTVFGLIVYMLMHNVLNENGKKVSFLLPHIGGVVDFIYLIRDVSDDKKKAYYRRILWSLFISIISFVGIALTFFVIPMQS
jgi:hypothetical protein